MTWTPPHWTTADYEAASRETQRLSHELDITNADHVALWLEANALEGSFGWLGCRIVEVHEARLAELEAERDGLREALQEHIDECFDEACDMCARHQHLLARQAIKHRKAPQ